MRQVRVIRVTAWLAAWAGVACCIGFFLPFPLNAAYLIVLGIIARDLTLEATAAHLFCRHPRWHITTIVSPWENS